MEGFSRVDNLNRLLKLYEVREDEYRKHLEKLIVGVLVLVEYAPLTCGPAIFEQKARDAQKFLEKEVLRDGRDS